MRVVSVLLQRQKSWLDEAERQLHRPERTPVKDRNAELVDRGLMLRRAVPFVTLETVARIIARQFHHQPVARYLRDDRGCRNRQALGVTLDDGARRHRKPWRAVAVDEDEFWFIRELRHGLGHRPQRCAENVVAIDAIDVGYPHGDDRDLHDALVEIGSRIFVEHLAVVDVWGEWVPG